MNILQICNKPPFPPQDGGAIGMHNITQGLLDSGHMVKVLSVNTPKHFVDINKLPEDYRLKTKIEFGFINTDLSYVSALYNIIFSKRSYNIIRFEDAKFEELLIQNLNKEQFDVVQIESIFLNYYVDIIRKNSKAKIVLRSPNVEFMIWERMASMEKHYLKKNYLSLLAKRLKREELAALNKFDALYTVTENDLEIYFKNGCIIPMEYIPTGVDVSKSISENPEGVEYPSIFHIGALDWMPNQEGLIWFLDNVWVTLNKKFPSLKFYIAGRGDASWFIDHKYPNVELLGEIDDAASFIKSKAIMIVPLFSGSGMRVKIIEGMAMSKAIVSTSVGIEGIIHQKDENVLIANKSEEFIIELSSIIEEKSKFDYICERARNNIKQYYGSDVLTTKLIKFLDTIV